MDQELRKLIEENQKLIRENIEITLQNQKKLKKIRLFIRRTMIGKMMYWVLVIGITASAFYISKPYINNVIDSYNSLKENIDRSTEIINNPGAIFSDVNVVERILGSH